MANDGQSRQTGLDSYRRDVMKLLGAGTAIGAFGGAAAADEHQVEPADGEEEETADDGDAPTDGSVHVVRTLIAESTNPERPADFFFQPTGLHVEPGDVVKFVFETPDHTVTTYHPAFGMQRRIPSDVQPFSTPVMGWEPQSVPDDLDLPPMENGEQIEGELDEENGENGDEAVEPEPSSWLYSFETPGVYDLECAPHEGFGMAMRVVVGEETETDFETSNADELPPPRAGPVELAREVLTDPNLDPEAIVEEGRVEWMDLEVNAESENGGTDGEEGDDEETDDDGVENGTDDVDVENGTDDGVENVTDDGAENVTDDGVENATDNGVENVTDDGVENATDDGDE